MSALASITKGRTSKPPRVLLYGPEGIGKSTFGAGCPKPIFIQIEDGLDEIEADKFPRCDTLDDFSDHINALLHEKHDYQTVVIDSADWLENLIHKDVCQSSKVASIELAAGGYGKGYGVALEMWRSVLEKLDRLRNMGMIVVLLAHARVERFEDPDQSITYDRYSLKLNNSQKFSSAALLSEWVDALLFATRRIRVNIEKKSNDKIRATAVAIGRDGGERIIRPYGSPSAVAKNRYGLTSEIPLSWNSFAEAVAAAHGNGTQSAA